MVTSQMERCTVSAHYLEDHSHHRNDKFAPRSALTIYLNPSSLAARQGPDLNRLNNEQQISNIYLLTVAYVDPGDPIAFAFVIDCAINIKVS